MKASVLLIGNFLSSSVGTRFYCEDLADRLRLGTWKVLTSSNKQNRPLRLIDMILTAYLKRKEYSVAHVDVYSGAAFLWADVVCRVLKFIGKPYILTLHGGNLPSFGNHWRKRVIGLFASAVKVTTPSPYLFETMRVFRADLYLLPNAIELPSYSFRLREKAHPQLIWLRSFHSIYNPCLGAKAVSILKKEFPDIHLTMIGHDRGDGTWQTLQELVSELQIENQISFCRGVPKGQVSHCMSKGDIFINTSDIDNTPITILEAMACGLCVVSTNVGGIPHLLKHEHDASLVRPDDAAAMASAIRRILTETGLAKELSRNGRKRVEEFDWSIIFPQWDKLLRSASTSIN